MEGTKVLKRRFEFASISPGPRGQGTHAPCDCLGPRQAVLDVCVYLPKPPCHPITLFSIYFQSSFYCERDRLKKEKIFK